MAVVNPINYSESTGQALLQGLRAGSAIQGFRSLSNERDQIQQQQDRQNQFYTTLQNTPPDQLHTLRTQYPDFADMVQKEIGIQNAEHATFVNNALNKISVAAASGNPAAVQESIAQNKSALMSFGVDPQEAIQMAQNDPQQFNRLLSATRLATMPIDKQVATQQKQQELDETARNNDMTNARGIRGQDISRENSMRSASGGNALPSSIREYQYFQSLSPEQQKTYLRVNGRKGGEGLRQAQLSSGETVMISPNAQGAGNSKYYEGVDADGNVITVPASALSSAATAGTSASQGLMNSDLGNIFKAAPGQLKKFTGVTGTVGQQALGADVLSRVGSKEDRQIYNSARRIQGYQQNQGIAAAREMGASGINTVAEARMYFQSQPQLDFASPDALIASAKLIDDYTKAFNAKNKVNLGSNGVEQPPTGQPQQKVGSGSYTSKSGIQFTVK